MQLLLVACPLNPGVPLEFEPRSSFFPYSISEFSIFKAKLLAAPDESISVPKTQLLFSGP